MQKKRRYKVKSKRNSYCPVPLESLDWNNWFTDRSWGMHYLHVEGEDGAIVGVYCKHSDEPRLAMENGELYWLVSPSVEYDKDESYF